MYNCELHWWSAFETSKILCVIVCKRFLNVNISKVSIFKRFLDLSISKLSKNKLFLGLSKIRMDRCI